MRWFRKNVADEERDSRRLAKVQESQLALLNAATSTANAAEDVTSMLKARLDDSLRQIEITAQLLSDALIVCHSDGVIDSVNSAAERIFGWKKSDIQGRDISALFRDEVGDPISSAMIMHKLFNCHEGGLEDEHFMDCIRGKRRNGDLFWVEVNINHVDRADGSSIVILVCRDATDRIETKRLLELNELRFRSMFEASLDGIIVAQNHYLVAANPAVCRLLGYAAEDLVSRPIANIIAPEHQVAVHKLHALRLLGDDIARTYVIKLMRSDGETVDVLVSSTGMHWGGGILASLMMVKNLGDIQ
jgi:PAS domain S-box-containing protein